jgi:molybdopterin synthase sulfur carrier subunit
MAEKIIQIRYFAMMGEKRGCQTESLKTTANTPEELFNELRTRHDFKFTTNIVKVAINDRFEEWNTPLKDGDTVALLPPFSGG